MIGVAVRENHKLDRLVSHRLDFGHGVIVSSPVLGVNEDDPFVGKEHRHVATPIRQGVPTNI